MTALYLLPERNCATCTDRQKKTWGCDAAINEKGEWVNKGFEPVVFDGEDYWGCLRRPVKDDPVFFAELMEHYSLFKDGVLPDDGGLSSQASKYVTLMKLVHGVVGECRAAKTQDA